MMNVLKFKTNIQCNGCVAKVSPVLNENPRILKWEVDLSDKDRVLTVTLNGLSAEQLAQEIAEVGFRIQLL